MQNVAILIFNEVEVLDFAGPFEVFSLAEDASKNKLFNTFIVAESENLVKARNGLTIKPKFSIKNCPSIDILIVPGGYGAEKIEINNKVILQWIYDTYQKSEITASICTGAFLLAEAKIIINQNITTHWMDVEYLQKKYPELVVIKNIKYIDNGKIITSAGISSGIEMSLHIIDRKFGLKKAKEISNRMEYNWDEKNLTTASTGSQDKPATS